MLRDLFSFASKVSHENQMKLTIFSWISVPTQSSWTIVLLSVVIEPKQALQPSVSTLTFHHLCTNCSWEVYLQGEEFQNSHKDERMGEEGSVRWKVRSCNRKPHSISYWVWRCNSILWRSSPAPSISSKVRGCGRGPILSTVLLWVSSSQTQIRHG